MRKFLCLMLVLLITSGLATVSAAITVDGVIDAGEWDGFIVSDATDDNSPSGVEMGRWGTKVENGYLYWCCELVGQTYADFYGQEGTKWRRAYPGLWLDVDASANTYLTNDGTPNCADDGKKEWGENDGNPGNVHRGVDIVVELDLENDWSNGGSAHYQFWGYDDDAALQFDEENGDVIADGSWSFNGSVVEAKVSLSELSTHVALLGETTVGDYMVAGVGVQGSNYADITWGYDVDIPMVIASDPDNKPLLPGDANLDGKVDGSDVTILANNWQSGVSDNELVTWSMGDFNRDRKVDGSDVTILANNWQEGVAAAGVASVPEPGTLLLLAGGLVSLLFWYKKR